MSRAFVKEQDNAAPPPERMVSDGPNLVTAEGFARIAAEVERLETALKQEANVLLRETLERDLRYWSVRKASAEIVPPPTDGTIAFGSKVTFLRNGRKQTIRIVGGDEADPKNGLVNFQAPLAAALIGARQGDIVEMKSPPGEIEIVEVGE